MNKPVIIGIIGAAGIIVIILINGLHTPDGARLFREKGCINCHSYKGQGGETAPDLTAVTERRSKSWIRRQVRDPKSHNPNSAMPAFKDLSNREINAIIKYLSG